MTKTGKAADIQDKASETGGKKLRRLFGFEGAFTRVWFALLPILFAVYILDLPLRIFNWSPYPEQYLAMFLAVGLPSVFLSFKAFPAAASRKIPWYDYIPAVISFVVFLRLSLFFEDFYFDISNSPTHLVVSGFFAILLVLEAARRLLGIPIVIVGLFFVLYTHFCYLAPKPLTASGEPWAILFSSFYADYSSLMGTPVGVVATMLTGFLFFGTALFLTGGGEFFSDIAMSLFGRQRGGAAKTAVVASALFGSISGNPAANVTITGMITIPLMKRTGFSPTFAAAVEATASTGGLILPPVMGITAFIMAEMLRIPYYQVAFAALIPALLFYIALYIQVHLEAWSQGVKLLDKSVLPTAVATLRKGWPHFIPIAVLLYLMFIERMSPGRAALYTGVAIFLVALARKEYRRKVPSMLWKSLMDTGRQSMLPMAACCVASLVIGAVSMTNLGTSLSFALTQAAAGSLLILLCLAAVASIILGMGMPIAATYILTATLIAPAMVSMGLKPIAAHMFLNYFGTMSFLTPPVCIAAFVAAGIADSPMMGTGFRAVRLALVAYVVPFAFCYDPSLVGQGTLMETVVAIAPLLVGIIFLSIGNAGYFRTKLPLPLRLIFAGSGVLMLIPHSWFQWVGFAVGVVILVVAMLMTRRAVPAEANA